MRKIALFLFLTFSINIFAAGDDNDISIQEITPLDFGIIVNESGNRDIHVSTSGALTTNASFHMGGHSFGRFKLVDNAPDCVASNNNSDCQRIAVFIKRSKVINPPNANGKLNLKEGKFRIKFDSASSNCNSSRSNDRTKCNIRAKYNSGEGNYFNVQAEIRKKNNAPDGKFYGEYEICACYANGGSNDFVCDNGDIC